MLKTSSKPAGLDDENIREMLTKGTVCQSQKCPLCGNIASGASSRTMFLRTT